MANPISTPTTRIKKLPPLLINQLAAGEIVTRPASVVKELLENAIDAGATKIDIKVTQGGMGMIEVSDNGCGIHPDDMVMAVTRHATSKVADVANLQGIRTLGFRGEALASTAAVSRLTLSSSHDDSGIGRQLSVAGILEDTPILTPIVHEQGTTVLVKDLYFNVPARRGNLKSVATEFAHIESVVREVALAHADVSLTLFHDQRKRLVLLAGMGDQEQELAVSNLRLPLSRLEQALGMSLVAQSMALSVDLSALLDSSAGPSATNILGDTADSEFDYRADTQTPQIQGWLWASSHSAQPLPKLIYVNGRLIKDPIIAGQLRQTIQSLALNHFGYALYFELPTAWLNVNVHPSKQRINIHALANIMAHLNYAIKAQFGVFSAKDQPLNSAQNKVEKTVTCTDLGQKKPSSDQVQSSSLPYQSDPTTSALRWGATAQSRLWALTGSHNNNDHNDNNDSIDHHNRHHNDHREARSAAISIESAAFDAGQKLTESAANPIGAQDLPKLLHVITDPSLLGSRLLSPSVESITAQSPLLLLFWQQQHLLIHYDVWLSLLEQVDEAVEPAQMTAATVYEHYQSSLKRFYDTKGDTTWLSQHLPEQALAVLDLPQLLSIMLSLTPKSGDWHDG